MLPNQNPTLTKSWSNLEHLAEQAKSLKMSKLFQENVNRFDQFSIEKEGFLLDYSKNIITNEIFNNLQKLAEECGLQQAIDSMFKGSTINVTENRAVLHTALRNPENSELNIDGHNIMVDINQVKVKMKKFSTEVRNGNWKGFTGKKFKNIVNIGIGGSDLGPLMVCEALKSYADSTINIFFVSNIDASHLVETLKNLDPEETLFLIASKTFTTQETMTNAFLSQRLVSESGKRQQVCCKTFYCVINERKGGYRFWY
jgi:glucose-6-phosphate isomerase